MCRSEMMPLNTGNTRGRVEGDRLPKVLILSVLFSHRPFPRLRLYSALAPDSKAVDNYLETVGVRSSVSV